MQKVYTFKFPIGGTVENSVLGPQDIEGTIKGAATDYGAKIDKNSTSAGMRTMIVRMTADDKEALFKLACPMLPVGER